MSHLDWWEWAMAAVVASLVVAMVVVLYVLPDPDETSGFTREDLGWGPGDDDTPTGGVWQVWDGEEGL